MFVVISQGFSQSSKKGGDNIKSIITSKESKQGEEVGSSITITKTFFSKVL